MMRSYRQVISRAEGDGPLSNRLHDSLPVPSALRPLRLITTSHIIQGLRRFLQEPDFSVLS